MDRPLMQALLKNVTFYGATRYVVLLSVTCIFAVNSMAKH